MSNTHKFVSGLPPLLLGTHVDPFLHRRRARRPLPPPASTSPEPSPGRSTRSVSSSPFTSLRPGIPPHRPPSQSLATLTSETSQVRDSLRRQEGPRPGDVPDSSLPVRHWVFYVEGTDDTPAAGNPSAPVFTPPSVSTLAVPPSRTPIVHEQLTGPSDQGLCNGPCGRVVPAFRVLSVYFPRRGTRSLDVCPLIR